MRHSALTCPLLHTASYRTRKHIAGFKAVKQLESPNMWLFFKTWRQPLPNQSVQSALRTTASHQPHGESQPYHTFRFHLKQEQEMHVALFYIFSMRASTIPCCTSNLFHTAVTHRKRPCSTCSTMNCRLKWNKEEFSDLYRVCTGMCDLLPSCCWFHLFGSSCKTLRLALSLHWCVLLCLHYALWNMFLS